MTTRRNFFGIFAATGAALGAGLALRPTATAAAETFVVGYSDAEWRKRLSADQYSVLRKEGTERPYSSPLNAEHRAGTFACAGCAQPVFSSTTKFDSGTGWPSFWQPLGKSVTNRMDTTFGMVRTAAYCSRCGGHLGHVFDDGPKPTGLRYCINGVAMTFAPDAG